MARKTRRPAPEAEASTSRPVTRRSARLSAGKSSTVMLTPPLPSPKKSTTTTRARKGKAIRAKTPEKDSPHTELLNIVKNLAKLKSTMGNVEVPILPEFRESIRDVLANENKRNKANLSTDKSPEEINESLVCLNVTELIIKVLRQKKDFNFDNEFAFFATELDHGQIHAIRDPVKRTQMLYVDTLLSHITNIKHTEIDFKERQRELLWNLPLNVNRPHQPTFDLNSLFPAFFYVVKRLVEYHVNWKELDWAKKECEDGDFERLQRRHDDMWTLVLETTLEVMKKMKITDIASEWSGLRTGTVFLFAIFMAKSWYGTVYFDRLDASNTMLFSHSNSSWSAFNLLGSFLLNRLSGNVIIPELFSLIEPILQLKQSDKLMLSCTEITTMLRQLVEMTPQYGSCNALMCRYFNLGFEAITKHHLVKYQQANSIQVKDQEVTNHSVPDSWQDVALKIAEKFPVPISGKVTAWWEVQPNAAMDVLRLLNVTATKYIIAVLGTRADRKQFESLKSILNFFGGILKSKQLNGFAMIASMRMLMDAKK